MISKQTLIMSIVIAVLATTIVVGGVAFYFTKQNSNTTPPQTTTQAETQEDNKEDASDSEKPSDNTTADQASTNNNTSDENSSDTAQTNNTQQQTQQEDTEFENSHFKIKLQPGWKAKGQPTGIVNITKGDYIFFINPRFKQASGVEGARLGEIIAGSPSGDLVTVYQPAIECSDSAHNFENVSGGWKRYSLYTDAFVDPNLCKRPTDNKTHWYFSYYVLGEPYVTYIDNNHQEYGSYVVTLSVKRNKVNDLPIKDSTELLTIFEDVNMMLESLKVK